jgi:predicted DNA-binding protein with PD1-like motif
MIVMQADNGRELVVRLADGEDLVAALRGLVVRSAVIVAGIGMVRSLRLGYWNGRAYVESQIDEPAELLSLQGNIATSPSGKVVHAHVAVAAEDGVVRGGHLVGATVANTAEIALLLVPGIRLARRPEPSGLTALVPSAEDGART